MQTGPTQTLLVNSKMRGKVVLHTMFEGQRDRSHVAGDTCSLRLAIDCCAFTNRVCADSVGECAVIDPTRLYSTAREALSWCSTI
jgi:hypothetical protein